MIWKQQKKIVLQNVKTQLIIEQLQDDSRNFDRVARIPIIWKGKIRRVLQDIETNLVSSTENQAS